MGDADVPAVMVTEEDDWCTDEEMEAEGQEGTEAEGGWGMCWVWCADDNDGGCCCCCCRWW